MMPLQMQPIPPQFLPHHHSQSHHLTQQSQQPPLQPHELFSFPPMEVDLLPAFKILPRPLSDLEVPPASYEVEVGAMDIEPPNAAATVMPGRRGRRPSVSAHTSPQRRALALMECGVESPPSDLLFGASAHTRLRSGSGGIRRASSNSYASTAGSTGSCSVASFSGSTTSQYPCVSPPTLDMFESEVDDSSTTDGVSVSDALSSHLRSSHITSHRRHGSNSSLSSSIQNSPPSTFRPQQQPQQLLAIPVTFDPLHISQIQYDTATVASNKQMLDVPPSSRYNRKRRNSRLHASQHTPQFTSVNDPTNPPQQQIHNYPAQFTTTFVPIEMQQQEQQLQAAEQLLMQQIQMQPMPMTQYPQMMHQQHQMQCQPSLPPQQPVYHPGQNKRQHHSLNESTIIQMPIMMQQMPPQQQQQQQQPQSYQPQQHQQQPIMPPYPQSSPPMAQMNLKLVVPQNSPAAEFVNMQPPQPPCLSSINKQHPEQNHCTSVTQALPPMVSRPPAHVRSNLPVSKTRTALIGVLSCVLENLFSNPNDTLPSDPAAISMFHTERIPSISIGNYLDRIAWYSECSEEALVMAFIHISRIFHSSQGAGSGNAPATPGAKCFQLNTLSIHRLLLVAIMTASKFYDDAYYNNAFFGKVGGVTTRELNALEVEFLALIAFELYIPSKIYRRFYKELTNSSLHPKCSCSYQTLPPLQFDEDLPQSPAHDMDLNELIHGRQGAVMDAPSDEDSPSPITPILPYRPPNNNALTMEAPLILRQNSIHLTESEVKTF